MNDVTQKLDTNKAPFRGIYHVLGCVIFFLCLFLYFYKVVCLDLIYHKFAFIPGLEPFETEYAFFANFVDKPGHLLNYSESFLFQWYYLNFSASLVTTLLVLVMFVASYGLFTAFRVRGRLIFAYMISIAVAVMFNTYENVLVGCLGLTITIILTDTYLFIVPKKTFVRGLVFVAAFVPLYYVAAGFSLLFLLLVAVYEVLFTRRITLAVTEVLLAIAAVFITGVLVCDMSVKQAFLWGVIPGEWLPSLSSGIFYGMYGIVLLAALVSGLWKMFASDKKERVACSGLKQFTLLTIQLILVAVAAVVSLKLTFNQKDKTLITSTKLARECKWKQLIELGQKKPWLQRFIFFNHDHNRALFHTGLMETDLFKYPQNNDALLLTAEEVQHSREYYESVSQIMLELGFVNSAERNCYELLEGSGNWPIILERLAMVNLAKKQYQTATVFLNKLSKHMVQGNKAKKILDQLRDDPELLGNERIQHYQSIAITEEDFPDTKKWSIDLYEWLLKKNPKNKMAFQYMMAEYLLKEDFGKIAENIHLLDDLGYDTLPRYYEEALVIETQLNGPDKIPEKWRPSQDALMRGQTFLNIYTAYKQGMIEIDTIRASEYGDSFYFYFMFN